MGKLCKARDVYACFLRETSSQRKEKLNLRGKSLGQIRSLEGYIFFWSGKIISFFPSQEVCVDRNGYILDAAIVVTSI